MAGGSHTPGAPRRRPPCSAPPVGGGLRPAPLGKCSFSTPLSVISGTFPALCRGGPMCPPGHAFLRDPPTGRHAGRPLQILLQPSSTPKNRAGTEPRPYRSIVVRSSGPMYLRHGFRRPNFVPKFGASVIGIGPYEKERKFHQPPGPAAHSGASAPAGARKWVGIAAKIIPKVSSNLGQSLSRPLGDSSLCTREPFPAEGGEAGGHIGPPLRGHRNS